MRLAMVVAGIALVRSTCLRIARGKDICAMFRLQEIVRLCMPVGEIKNGGKIGGPIGDGRDVDTRRWKIDAACF